MTMIILVNATITLLPHYSPIALNFFTEGDTADIVQFGMSSPPLDLLDKYAE
jgi:hypothetical protein